MSKQKAFKNIFFFSLLLGLFVFYSFEAKSTEQFIAKNGTLDLREWDFSEKEKIDLKGEWKFVWKKLIEPEELFFNEELFKKSSIYNMPSNWNSIENGGDKGKSHFGSASFILKIKFSENAPLLSTFLHDAGSAYELFLISPSTRQIKVLTKSGIVGDSAENSIPQYRPQTSPSFQPEPYLYLLLRISNYHNHIGGPWYSITLGESQKIKNDLLFSRLQDAGLIGLLLIMGLYHIGLFLQRREDKPSLFFSFVCFVVAIRQLVVAKLPEIFLSEPSEILWLLSRKIDYATIYLSTLFFTLFIVSLIPAKWLRKVVKFNIYFSLAYLCITIFTAPTFFGKLLIPYQIYIMLIATTCIAHLIMSASSGNKVAKYSLLGFMPFVLSIVNDILYSQQVINTAFLFPYGFGMFILAQSYTLSKIFSDTFSQNNALLKDIQIKEKERTQIFHNTSHELRTPLNGIIGFCEMIPRENLAPENQSRIAKIKNLSLSLKQQVNTILDLAKDQKGDLKADFMLIDTDEIFENVKILAEGLSQKKPAIDFTLSKEGNIPKNFIHDEKMLLGILRNLLGNAFKFTPNEKNNKILVNFDFESEGFSLKVSDTGIGIAKEEHSKIFKEFTQIEGDARRKYEGSGLELSIVDKYAKSLNAEISLESEPGKGTSFHIYFPYFDEDKMGPVFDQRIKQREGLENFEKTSAEKAPNLAHHENQKYLIFVVDDNEVNLEVFEGILGSAGYRTKGIQGGAQCLEVLESQTPDLLILDLMMPEVSGEDVLRSIRSKSTTSSLPVILVTARASRQDKIFGLNLGADDYLAKPVDKDEFLLKTSATLARIELAKTTEKMIEREKMAQLGEMLGEISHEIKNIQIGSTVDSINEQKETINSILKSSISDDEVWSELTEAMIFNERKYVSPNSVHHLEIPSELPRNMIIPLKRLRRTLSSTEISNEKLSVIWSQIIAFDDLTKEKICNLFSITESLLIYQSSSKRIDKLIKGVLDFARNDSSENGCDLFSPVNTTLNLLEKKIYFERIQIENDLEQGTEVLFSGSDLSQVVLNLIANSIDALGSNSNKDRKIKIFTKSSENKINLHLLDNGPGIPEDIQKKIFERNFSTKGTKGSGLGLFICSKIVTRNEGSIFLDSKPGATEFILTMKQKLSQV